MPTTITPTQTNGANVSVIPRNNGEEDSITIDNDNFDDAHDFIIEKRDIPELLIQLQNTGNTNTLSYEVYCSIDPSQTPPVFSLISWELLNGASGDIAQEENDLLVTLIHTIWILVRLKRTTSSLDTTAKIVLTSGRSA